MESAAVASVSTREVEMGSRFSSPKTGMSNAMQTAKGNHCTKTGDRSMRTVESFACPPADPPRHDVMARMSSSPWR